MGCGFKFCQKQSFLFCLVFILFTLITKEKKSVANKKKQKKPKKRYNRNLESSLKIKK